jgi:hypothetical protein
MHSTFVSIFLFKFTGDMPFRTQMTNIYLFFSYLKIYPPFLAKTSRPFWDSNALPPVGSLLHFFLESALVSDTKTTILHFFYKLGSNEYNFSYKYNIMYIYNIYICICIFIYMYIYIIFHIFLTSALVCDKHETFTGFSFLMSAQKHICELPSHSHDFYWAAYSIFLEKSKFYLVVVVVVLLTVVVVT